jgi:hypothetical protein
MNDNFKEYVETGSLKQPQPPEKLVTKIIKDIQHR